MVERLERSGFALSPGDRVRLLRVLAGPGKLYLNQPQRLKYLLCPVVARTAAEQNLFYELFDKWWSEMSAPLDEKPLAKKGFPWKWLIAALLLIVIAYKIIPIIITWLGHPPLEEVIETTVGQSVGDTFSFVHPAGIKYKYANQLQYEWQLVDDQSNRVEITGNSPFQWSFVLDTLVGGYDKTVKLKVSGKKNNVEFTKTIPLRFFCKNEPRIVDIIYPEDIKANQNIRFNAEVDSRPGLSFQWDFGDGGSSGERSPYHTFKTDGQYPVTLTIEDTLAQGYCTAIFTETVSIGIRKALLVNKALHEDKLSATAVFGWATFVLLGILGLAIVYCWVKWAMRKAPPIPVSEPVQIDSPDRAPYFIPWMAQEKNVRVGKEQFRLGDAMRLRQEGLRLTIDVPGSVKRTIEKGGFPDLRFKYNTRPTDYLCLVDEQTHVSHQARLFKYLVEMLRSQDVHLELFYYDTEFNRYWNRNYPEGVGLEVLQRLYPEHRLVVMGDAHALLDPRVEGLPRLRPEYTHLLRAWRQRLLLTPMPPKSWTYKEGLLYSFFALFPADLRGQSEAATFVETGLDAEDLPTTFSQWHDLQQIRRQDPDINYRRWRTWGDHLKYLDGRPDLALWLQALSVYPSPTWELTIAIGKALEPQGVVVNFDNLLLLARIPWLQNGRLEPRLREEMLRLLDPQIERIAREAVLQELEAVREQSKQGYANLSLETDLAIQNFALAPDNRDHHEAIAYLLDRGHINPRREAELNQVVNKHIANTANSSPKQQMSKGGYFSPPEESIREYLEKRKENPKPPEKPFFTPMFMWAAGLSLLFVVLWICCWMLSGSEILEKWVRPNNDKALQDTSLRNYYFVKEIQQIDSAVWYNNRGVSRWYGEKDTAAVADFRFALAYESSQSPANIRINKEALIRANQNGSLKIYPLAESNWGKAYYNAAVALYMTTFSDSLFSSPQENLLRSKKNPNKVLRSLKRETGSEEQFQPFADKNMALNSALELFRLAAAFDSTAADALHGMGLCHFYQNNRDSATYYYQAALSRTDSLFFDTLKLAPNLETLLGIRTTRITDVRVLGGTPNELYVIVNYYFEPDKYRSLDLNLAPLNKSGQVPRNFNAIATKALPGIGSDTLVLKKPAKLSGALRTDSLRVRLLAPKSRAVVAEKVIEYAQSWETAVELPNSSDEKFVIKRQVLDANDKKPVQNAQVSFSVERVQPARSRFGAETKTVQTDIQGYFTITYDNKQALDNMANSSSYFFKILITKNNYQRLELPLIAVKDKLDTSPLFITPQRPQANNANLQLTLYLDIIDDSTNNLIDAADVELRNVSTGAVYTQNAYGKRLQFDLPATNANTFVVKVTRAGYIPAEENIVFQSGETSYTQYITLKKEVAQQTQPNNQQESLSIYFDHNEPQKLRKGLLKELQDLYSAFYARRELYKKMAAKSSNYAETVKKIDDFYEKKVRAGFSNLQQQLDRISAELSKGSRVRISLSSFCSNQESGTQELALRRIRVVGDFINNYDKGLLQQYIKSGALTITEEPYSDDITVQNSKVPQTYDPDNFDLDASQSRRTDVDIVISSGAKRN